MTSPRLSKLLLFAALLVPLAAAAEARMPPRAIGVSGEGMVSTMPDRADVSLAVEIVDPALEKAESGVAESVRSVLAAARRLGIDAEDLASGAVSVRPEYVWDEAARRQKMVGYRVRRDIQVQVRKLEVLGDLLQAATKAGVTEVSPPVLKSSRETALQREALVKATQDARDKAAILAKTLDVALGPVLRLDAGQGGSPAPVPMMKASRMVMADAESGNTEMGLSTGRIEFRATVHAEFELKP